MTQVENVSGKSNDSNKLLWLQECCKEIFIRFIEIFVKRNVKKNVTTKFLSFSFCFHLNLAIAIIWSVTSFSACAFKLSIQPYPTPSLNCSFWRQSTSAGRYGFSGVSKALRRMYFSIRPYFCVTQNRKKKISNVNYKNF